MPPAGEPMRAKVWATAGSASIRRAMVPTAASVSSRELPGGRLKLASSTPSLGSGKKLTGTSASPARLTRSRTGHTARLWRG